MTTTKNKNATFEALQRWRQALSEGVCIEEFHVSDDGKGFDYELKEESEYSCKDCFAFFCFRTLEWDDDQESGTSKETGLLTEHNCSCITPEVIPQDPEVLPEVGEYLIAYV